jgi:hypothetical protein
MEQRGEGHRGGLLPLRQSVASPRALCRCHGHVLSFSCSHGVDGGRVARRRGGRQGYGGGQREMERARLGSGLLIARG